MKCFLTIILLFSFTNIFAQTTQEAQTCLNKGKEFFEQKEYSYAQRTLEDCLKNNPKNVDILVSLGGICMKQEDYDNSLNYFITALKNMTKKSPYISYVYTRIGDIYTHKKDFVKAGRYYEASLKFEPANINSLVGKGICEEQTGNIQKAAEYFKKALSVDFTNIVARRRLIALEPDILSHEEILSTMKERNIIDPHALDYQEQDLDLLKKMLNAERNRAIAYLNEKYKDKVPSGLIVEKYPGKLYSRKMLSYSGYKDLMFLLSQDAINFFLEQKIHSNEILKLRDLEGNKIFDEQGFLTDEGLKAYTLTLNGQKAYLLPLEPLPAGVRKAEKIVQELMAKGYYEEIRIDEFGEIMKESRCSQETLVKYCGVEIIPVYENKNRYLIINSDKHPNPLFKVDHHAIPYTHFVNISLRKKNKDSFHQTPVYTSTFGTGNARPYDCNKDGTLQKTIFNEDGSTIDKKNMI